MSDGDIEAFRKKWPERYNLTVQAAVEAERKRWLALDAIKLPGLEKTIKQAQLEGKEVGEVELEMFHQTKQLLESKQRMDAIMRDSAAIRSIPAGNAPTKKPEKVNLLKKAFRGRMTGHGG
jgi:hypothetical protein